MERKITKKTDLGNNVNIGLYISCELYNELVDYLEKNNLNDVSNLVATLIALFLKTDTIPKHNKHYERLGNKNMWKRKR